MAASGVDRKSMPLPLSHDAAHLRLRHAFLRKHSDSNHTAALAEKALIMQSLRHFSPSAAGANTEFYSLAQLHEMADCTQRLAAEGRMWNYAAATCDEVPGFRAPLRSHEVSLDELSCSAPDARKAWLARPFESLTNPNATLDHLKVNSNNHNAVTSLMQVQYSRFIFYSSWLFEQYRPWRPLPVVLVVGNATEGEAGAAPPQRPREFLFSAAHYPAIENVLRVRNLCVHPLLGILSGVGASRDSYRYKGVDDTSPKGVGQRGVHNEAEFPRLFSDPIPRRSPPAFFDRRPVVFFPAMHLSSHNMAHSHFKFWSLLGLLKLDVFSSRTPSRPQPPADAPPTGWKETEDDAATSQTEQPAEQLKPLIMFVLSPSPREASRARAFGFMYMMLDLPWAVQLASPAFFLADADGSNASSTSSSSASLIRAMMRRAHHSESPDEYASIRARALRRFDRRVRQVCSSTTVKTFIQQMPVFRKKVTCENVTEWVLRRDADPADFAADEMCFAESVVWQNAFEPLLDSQWVGDAAASFDFMNYQPINTWRRWMMARYESLLARCLPVQQLPSPPSSTASSEFRRPRIFFDVRTAMRGIWMQNLFMDWLRTELVQEGFASDVIFRELWKGSRAQYLDDVRTSDIFAGVHGGSFAVTMLLRPRPVVVEYAGHWSFCTHAQNGGGSRIQVPVGPFCWFEAQAQFKNASHWVYEFPTTTMDDRFSHVGSVAVLDSLREASCRWFMQNGFCAGCVENASLIEPAKGTFAAGSKRRHFSGRRAQPQEQQESRDAGVPKYCRDRDLVKYSDMDRLHVRLRQRDLVDAREMQFLLRRHFAVDLVPSASLNVLTKRLALIRDGLLLESNTPEVWQVMLMHVNPALRVFELPNTTTATATSTTSVRRKVACIKAESPFAPVANPPPGSTDLACLYASQPR